jgi:hypothetical protein
MILRGAGSVGERCEVEPGAGDGGHELILIGAREERVVLAPEKQRWHRDAGQSIFIAVDEHPFE